MNIQDECIKIHSKFGISEMANYKIQLLFDSEIEKVKKEYEEKLRWIPIEEKMPPEGETVLFKYEDFDCIVGFYTISQKFMAKLFFPLGINNVEIKNVTHWRFL